MMQNGTEYLESRGATNIQYLGNAGDQVYCKGSGTGMLFMVDAPSGDKSMPIAVCVGPFGDVTEGK